MSTALRMDAQGKTQTAYQPTLPTGDVLDTRIAVIQTLIPLGLQAAEEVLQQEVQTLDGPRYAREDKAPHLVRWGGRRALGPRPLRVSRYGGLGTK